MVRLARGAYGGGATNYIQDKGGPLLRDFILDFFWTHFGLYFHDKKSVSL